MSWAPTAAGVVLILAVVLAIRAALLRQVQIRPMSESDPCPACGHRRSTLRTVEKDGVVVVRFSCERCGAQSYRAPLVEQGSSRERFIEPGPEFAPANPPPPRVRAAR